MAGPRAVRIARGAPRPGTAAAFVPNTAGERRAWRLFGTFLLALVAIYVIFVGLAVSAPTPGPRDDLSAWTVLTVLAIGLAAGGWVITLGRTPRSASWQSGDLNVRDRWGRVRRFPAGPASYRRVVHHYPPSFLGPEATEMVELTAADRSRRTYLVGEGYFDRMVGGSP